MFIRLLFGLLWFAPTICFGALSTTTSYFLNVESLTNLTARSSVQGLTGVFTNGITSGSSTFTGTTTIATSATATETLGSGTVTNNVGVLLSVGDVTFVDVLKASQTNSVSGTLTITHATNGVHGVDYTHVRWIFNGSGSDQTLAIPSGWRTNVYSAVPPALTNGTITRMVLACGGPTSSAALQTNCYVSFEYFK